MRKEVKRKEFNYEVEKRLEELVVSKSNIDSKRGRMIKIGKGVYYYRNLRFSLVHKIVSVQFLKVDKDSYKDVYKFNCRKITKSYFYKTSLLLNGQIDKFCDLCLDEFESRR